MNMFQAISLTNDDPFQLRFVSLWPRLLRQIHVKSVSEHGFWLAGGLLAANQKLCLTIFVNSDGFQCGNFSVIQTAHFDGLMILHKNDEVRGCVKGN